MVTVYSGLFQESFITISSIQRKRLRQRSIVIISTKCTRNFLIISCHWPVEKDQFYFTVKLDHTSHNQSGRDLNKLRNKILLHPPNSPDIQSHRLQLFQSTWSTPSSRINASKTKTISKVPSTTFSLSELPNFKLPA